MTAPSTLFLPENEPMVYNQLNLQLAFKRPLGSQKWRVWIWCISQVIYRNIFYDHLLHQANKARWTPFPMISLQSQSILHNWMPHYCDDSGSRLLLTANILDVILAVKPSTCLEYCSTCLAFSIPSNLLGSTGSLKSLCHSSSGSGVCLLATRAAFSA